MLKEIISCDDKSCENESESPLAIMMFINDCRYDYCSLDCLSKNMTELFGNFGLNFTLNKIKQG